MGLLRRIWPDTALAMARLAAVILACASVVPSLPSNPGIGGTWRLAGSTGIALLVALYVTTFVRRRTFLMDPVMTAALIVVVGSSREDPDAIIGLCLGALTLLSMHSTFRQTIVRAVLVIGALLAGIALSPAAQAVGLRWNAEQNFALVPMLTMMALLNTAVNVLLQRQQRMAAREALLARTGLDLINVTDPDEVRRVVRGALGILCAEWPEHPALVVRRGSDGAEVEVALGALPALAGAAVPAQVVSGLPTTLTPVDDERGAVLDAVVGGVHRWHGLAFAAEQDDRLVLVAGRRIPVAFGDGLRAIATYWSLAETNCRVHAELGRRADSDQLTALYNRRWFLQRLAAARTATDGSSFDALLMIDLDDFKQVNDGYGHA
ncbi:MAG TPA: diguanylate cyclase, partial [Euzebyales bacterium]|nr:diguanylate cyclase [Euzebyales bacterium]